MLADAVRISGRHAETEVHTRQVRKVHDGRSIESNSGKYPPNFFSLTRTVDASWIEEALVSGS
jgi:hypothetical protein